MGLLSVYRHLSVIYRRIFPILPYCYATVLILNYRTENTGCKLVTFLAIHKLHMAVFCQDTRYPRVQTSISHRLGTEICHQRIASERIAHLHFIQSMSTKDTTRINNFHSIVKHQQANGCRLQKVGMHKRILKEFLQNGFRYLQLTYGIERLPILSATKTRFQPHHTLLKHLWNRSLYVTAVTIFCTRNTVAIKPHSLDNEYWLVPLRMLPEEKVLFVSFIFLYSQPSI